jgi:hypothetical protein
VESRRIFRKLKAYVTYRFAASIQIVVVLTLLIWASDCPIDSLMIILLALFNDLTMLPIAYDNQQASAFPEDADVFKMLKLSGLMGLLEIAFSLLWAYGAEQTNFFKSNFILEPIVGRCGRQAQAGVWVQMSIAAELLIFSARAPSFIWCSLPPSLTLFCSVIFGCFLFSLFTGVIPYFGYLHINDIVIIWAYDIICLFFIDCVKVAYLKWTGESTDVLHENKMDDELEVDEIPDPEAGKQVTRPKRFHSKHEEDDEDKSISITRRLSNWSDTGGGHDTTAQRKPSDINIIMSPGRKGSSTAIIATRRTSTSTNLNNINAAREKSDLTYGTNGVITAPRGNSSIGSSSGLRGSSHSLRPHTPASLVLARANQNK